MSTNDLKVSSLLTGTRISDGMAIVLEQCKERMGLEALSPFSFTRKNICKSFGQTAGEGQLGQAKLASDKKEAHAQ